MANVERTQWRDKNFSIRHHDYGSCPMVDIDCMEYDFNANPVALIDLKEVHAGEIDMTSSTIVAQNKLANLANLPFYVVRYDKCRFVFQVIAVNNIAKAKLKNMDKKVMCEQEFVRWLWFLRGNLGKPSKEFLAKFNTDSDWRESPTGDSYYSPDIEELKIEFANNGRQWLRETNGVINNATASDNNVKTTETIKPQPNLNWRKL